MSRFCYCPACDTVLAKDVSDEIAQAAGEEHRRERECGVSVEGNMETLDRTLAAYKTELSRDGMEQSGDTGGG